MIPQAFKSIQGTVPYAAALKYTSVILCSNCSLSQVSRGDAVVGSDDKEQSERAGWDGSYLYGLLIGKNDTAEMFGGL
jgi:hypothetical protein